MNPSLLNIWEVVGLLCQLRLSHFVGNLKIRTGYVMLLLSIEFVNYFLIILYVSHYTPPEPNISTLHYKGILISAISVGDSKQCSFFFLFFF